MRYQQGTYGLSQDLRYCRKQSMEISRQLDAVTKELEETKYELYLLREKNKLKDITND